MLQRVHLAVPNRRDRQLAPGGERGAYTLEDSARLGRAARAGGRRADDGSEIPAEIARLTAEAAGQGGIAPAPWSAGQPS